MFFGIGNVYFKRVYTGYNGYWEAFNKHLKTDAAADHQRGGIMGAIMLVGALGNISVSYDEFKVEKLTKRLDYCSLIS